MIKLHTFVLSILTVATSMIASGEGFDEILLEEFGELGRFKYGSSWWREHHNDPYTVLLMHFGKPRPYPLAELSEKGREQREKRENLENFLRQIGSRDSLRDSKVTIVTEIFREMQKKAEKQIESIIQRVRQIVELPPVEEPEVPTDTVYDYSEHRRVIPIGDTPGVSVTPEGKFGSALTFNGTGPGVELLEEYPEQHYNWIPTMAEFWVKIPSYPEKNACIFSAGGGEGRLMLRPDGRLELDMLNPYGFIIETPYNQWGMKEALKNIKEKNKNKELPTKMVSDRKVPLNEWFYVNVWNTQTFIINMQMNYIYINGEEVADMFGVPFDHHNFFAGQTTGDRSFKIGNDHQGNHPFTGTIDELRIPDGSRKVAMGGNPARQINPPPPEYPWRDADADRPLDFGRPFFYRNGHTFHLGFENDLNVKAFNGEDVTAELTRPIPERKRLFTDGIRGQALTVDPRITRLKIPIDGLLNTDEGSLEFWMRPVNWDDAGGRPKLPTYRISVMRLHAETPDGEELVFPLTGGGLPQRGRGEAAEFRPGKWSFFALTWDTPEPPKHWPHAQIRSRWPIRVYRDPTSPQDKGRSVNAEYLNDDAPGKRTKHLPAWAYNLKLKYLEIGVKNQAFAADGREPIIQVDEVVGHDYALSPIEVYQARKRVQGRLERFKSLKLSVDYKYGMDELTGSLRCLLAATVDPATATITVLEEDGTVFAGPVTSKITYGEEENEDNDAEQRGEGIATFMFSTGKRPPTTPLTFNITVKNPQGEVLEEDSTQTWTYRRREWRGNDLGVPRTAPEPWTPVEIEGRHLKTLMTEYDLGENGLPTAIIAKGENLLARPVQLLEDGKPMEAKGLTIGNSQDVEASWSVQFEGRTCDVTLNGRIEFDGLTRYELDVEPKTEDGVVPPLRFEIPMKPEYASHRIFQRLGGRLKVQEGGPDVYSGRAHELQRAQRRAKRSNRRRRGKTVEVPTDETFETWDFLPIMDLTNRERGLFWFADTAAGWGQSKHLPAQEFQRDDDEHRIVLHLIAETAKYDNDKPIVFGVIPHPAKGLPRDYRYFDRGPSPDDPDVRTTYRATFAPVPRRPKAQMTVYPRNRSWEYAESVRGYVEMMKPYYRTMYLSLAWLSCRAGGYDNWAWRNGDNSKVSLTDSFIEYLCWEMDEWLKRGIYNAIYLDESYAWQTDGKYAVQAGQALRMPDGTIQPGLRLWHFRKLMKRWYTLFGKYDRRPMLLAHHSRYWMYPGMVFATSNLDGEAFPLVTVHGRRDFVDKLDLSRFEVVNNPYLWGTVSFYMPSIWERGPNAKGDNPHPAWSWRMARGAQSVFAHLENGTTFVDQGGNVYTGYSRVLKEWGALHPKVEFVPYFKTADDVQAPGQGEDALVSYYRDDGRILLIVSNRKKEERPIPVTLDFAALGLPAPPSFKVLKGAYDRPEGIDPWRHDPPKPKKNDLRMEAVEMDPDSLTLEDPEKTKAREEAEYREQHRVKLNGNILTVPVRDHDFRVISLE